MVRIHPFTHRAAPRELLAACGVAAAVGAASLMFPVGIDEAVWSTIGRWVTQGRTLYVDAIDNKTPPVFVLAWLVDAAPGSFTATRALLVGSLAGWLTWATSRISAHSGAASKAQALTGGFVGVSTAFLGTFLLTTELLAAALIAGAVLTILRSRPWWGALLAMAAALFDPRAALLFPGCLLLTARTVSPAAARRTGLGLLLAVGSGVLALAFHPDLRYALVELNGASRQLGSWEADRFAAALVASLLPVGVGVAGLHATGAATLGRGAWAGPGWVLAAGGGAAAAISLQPFHHYWILAVPWLALTLGPPAPRSKPWAVWAIGLMLAALPLAGVAIAWRYSLTSWHRDYSEALAVATSVVPPDSLVMQFDQLPYVAWYAPDRTPLRSPWLAYLWWQTSRTERHLAEVEAALPRVAAIIEDGGLGVSEPQVSPPARLLWHVLRNELGAFRCRVTLGDLLLHLRVDTCPPGLRES